ncbi:hypothetical protein [Bosea massiliensis]|uniref:Uncharacterized protein n=1 Tax=Bosea massiliensis TaxID=151419 RepID=A0ABW0P5E1_9HYPH
MAKRERRGGRRAVENWHQRALELDAKLKDSRRGQRDGIFRTFAAELGVSASVPKRMIQALRFLEYVRDDVRFTHLAGEMAEQPFSALVLLDRWSQYSPREALSAGQRLIAGELNLPMLEARERADRAQYDSVLTATDGTWQTYAATRAVQLVLETHDSARCIWAARGWRPDGVAFTSLTLPGLLNALPAVPGVQLAFERENGAPLLVAILSDRIARMRSPAALVQNVLTLLGYTRLGCACLLLLREEEQAAKVEGLLASLDRPEGISARHLAFD